MRSSFVPRELEFKKAQNDLNHLANTASFFFRNSSFQENFNLQKFIPGMWSRMIFCTTPDSYSPKFVGVGIRSPWIWKPIKTFLFFFCEGHFFQKVHIMYIWHVSWLNAVISIELTLKLLHLAKEPLIYKWQLHRISL